MERRRFLTASGVAVAATVTGCVGGSTPSLQNDALANTETVNSGTKQSIRGEITLDAGQYYLQSLTPPRSVDMYASIHTDSPVDLYTMERQELNRYRDGEEFLFLQALSEQSTSAGVVRGTISEGEYSVLVDNTSMGKASPDGAVSGEFELSITV